MEYKALVSFSGAISMSMGEVREITDEKIVKDLLKAGYIHPVEPPSEAGLDPDFVRRPAAVIDKSKPTDNQSAARPLGQKGVKKGGKTKK